jgi:excinuclease UvrABC ATPase subunit
MPPQIKRLALLFAIFIGLFLVARHFLVPKSFGEFGHYRGLALAENQARAQKYAGQKACADCHQDMVDLKAPNVHKSLSCETCHGPGFDHVNSTDSVIPMRVPKTREFCATCHTKNAARRVENIVQIDVKEHNPDQKCIECHNPHNPWLNLK